jgi:LemA protein
MAAGLVLVSVGLIAFGLIGCYRGLAQERRRVRAAWDELEGELARRHALIPPLARVVILHLRLERAALEDLLDRAEAAAGQRDLDSVARRAALEAELERGLERLRALALVRPGLSADVDFQALVEQLQTADERLAVAQESYNTALDDYLDRLEGRWAKLLSHLTALPAPAYFTTANATARHGIETPAGPAHGLTADPAAVPADSAAAMADHFPGLGQASDTRPTFVPSFRLGDRRPASPGPSVRP